MTNRSTYVHTIIGTYHDNGDSAHAFLSATSLCRVPDEDWL